MASCAYSKHHNYARRASIDFPIFPFGTKPDGDGEQVDVPLAIAKHLMVTSDLLCVALLFHSGGSQIPQVPQPCMEICNLFQVTWISYISQPDQNQHSGLQKPSLLTLSNIYKKYNEHFLTNHTLLQHVPNICSSLLKTKKPGAVQGKRGRERDHQ